MRYSSALVLSTLAAGQAAAATINHRHASFHARREASKRSPEEKVNWNALAYDLKDVDWDAVNWSSVFASTPAAAPTPTPEEKKPAPAPATPTPEPKKETPAPSSAKPVESSKAAEPSAQPESPKDKIEDLVSDIMANVVSISSSLGAKVGKNSKANDGGLWVGGDGEWGMDVTNTGSKDAVWYCWQSNGFTGMIIKDNTPDISVGIKAGKTIKISSAPGISGACAPATDSSKMAIFGGLFETWAEFTFGAKGKDGAFNVSKNVNMRGCSISMQGAQCTSNMGTCVFQCEDDNAESCMTGYKLVKCDAGNGGGGGYDPIMQGVGGGCTMPKSGERLKISFN